MNILCVGRNENNTTTNINIIKSFLQIESNESKFIITTYKSCNILLDFNLSLIILYILLYVYRIH